MTATVRRYSAGAFFMQFLVGACVGSGLVGLVASRMIVWYATPGYQAAVLNCGPSIQEAMNQLLKFMLIGAGAFALLVPLALYLLLYRKKPATAPTAS